VVVRKGELVKFIDLLTKDGETSVVVDYCITYIKYCVVPLRKELLELRIKDIIYSGQPTTQRTSHSQKTCTLEKLV
jgi:hypothetical protein